MASPQLGSSALFPIPKEQWTVTKRDGRTTSWDESRVIRAISLAIYEVRAKAGLLPPENIYRNVPDARYGVVESDFLKAVAIATRVSRAITGRYYRQGKTPTIEQVQDAVEFTLASEGEWEIAKAFMLYREKKADQRINVYPENGITEYISISRYSRYREDLKRRELYPEAVERVLDMHLRKFEYAFEANPWLKETIERVYREDVVGKKVLGSMRAMQFGGAAVEAHEARMYNCAFTHINRLNVFAEYTYLGLCGVGPGFSVQKKHIDQLPVFPVRKPELDLPVVHHHIEDTIEGWADAVGCLFDSYLNNYKAEFSYSLIRPRGSRLKIGGGKAPGHIPLKTALQRIESLLGLVSGRRLKPIEAYDCLMYLAQAIVSGGVRRIATICLFSPDDLEMVTAKTGNWFETNPQRSYSNNSAVLLRKKASFTMFKELFEKQKEFGEPGFYFSVDPNYGTNPCCEIGMYPVLDVLSAKTIERLKELGYTGDVKIGSKLSGWQFCNLSTINGAKCKTPEDFFAAASSAATIGTLQAAYVNIPYLGPVTQVILEREALLGVSITGIMDSPEVLLDPATLEKGAQIVTEQNALIANAIGIRPAARTTCIKPEGTSSLVLGTGSGIHGRKDRRYFRRVQANKIDPVYQHFKTVNPHMCEPSVYSTSDDVITFPVEAPEGAILESEMDAVQFLQAVQLVQNHWVKPGRRHEDISPGLHHNVSNTVKVKPEEWDQVMNFIWKNREDFTGIALLPAAGDKTYAQAPMESLNTEEDIIKWNRLVPNPVDYSTMVEETDDTNLQAEAGCAGGLCDLQL